MINVGKAFTWDLLGNAYYMGELAARYPERAVDHLTPNISNTVIKDFIVESSKQFSQPTVFLKYRSAIL